MPPQSRPLAIPHPAAGDCSVVVRRAIEAIRTYLIGLRTPYIAYENTLSSGIVDVSSHARHSGDSFGEQEDIQWNMPANYFVEVGTVIKLKAWGLYVSVASSPPGIDLRIYIGPGIYLTTGSQSIHSPNGQKVPWWLEAELMVTAAGSSGSMRCSGICYYKDTDTATVKTFLMEADTPDIAIDFTSPHAWRLVVVWASENAGITIGCDHMRIEVWPPSDHQDNVPTVTFMEDLFTEGTNTSLAAHTPDTGGAWVQVGSNGATTVIANIRQVKLDQAGAGGNLFWKTATGYCNGTFKLSVFFDSGGDNSASGCGVMLRFVDTSNFLAVVVERFGGYTAGLSIFKCVGGSFTQMVADAFTPADDTIYNITAVLDGVTLTASVNGRAAISASVAALQETGTTHGIWFPGGTVNSFCHVLGPLKWTSATT